MRPLGVELLVHGVSAYGSFDVFRNFYGSASIDDGRVSAGR